MFELSEKDKARIADYLDHLDIEAVRASAFSAEELIAQRRQTKSRFNLNEKEALSDHKLTYAV